MMRESARVTVERELNPGISGHGNFISLPSSTSSDEEDRVSSQKGRKCALPRRVETH